MPVNYTSGELRLSGTVTNAEFYAATSTAGLSRNTENQYELGANMRVMSGADVSGLKNFILALNTYEIYSEDPSIVFNQITFIESEGRTTADRVVFKTAGSGKNPILNDCQFLHNIVGNPGGGDPRYLTMAHIGGASNSVFRASDFSEQEIDGVQLMESGVYRNISGIRVKRFIASLDPDDNAIRVILKDLKQSSKLYGTGGLICAYSGSSVMVVNWDKEILNSGATNNWLDNYNGHLSAHWVYILGSAADEYQNNGAGISQKKNTLHVVKGGYKYYKFINGEGGTFCYFDSRGSSPQACSPTTTRSDMLETDTTLSIPADEEIDFVTQTLTYNRDTGSWVQTNITGHRFLVRKYGYLEISQDLDNPEAVEGSPEAYSPFLMGLDDSIGEVDSTVVAAYTGITINSSAKTITITSGSWTPQKIYDYCKYWLTQNMDVGNFVTASGTNYEYTYRWVLNGSANLQHDPDTHKVTFKDIDIGISPLHLIAGSYVYGVETVSDGVTTYSSREGLVNDVSLGSTHGFNATYRESGCPKIDGGTFTWNGGIITTPTALSVEDGQLLLRKGELDVSSYDSSNSIGPTLWLESAADTLQFENLIVTSNSAREGLIVLFSKEPNTFDNVTMLNGGGLGFGGSTLFETDGTTAKIIEIKNYEATGGQGAARFWRRNYLKLINYNLGSDIEISGMLTAGNSENRGIIDIYREVDFHVTDATATNIEGANVYCIDTDDGNRPANYMGHSWTADKEYLRSTDSTGRTSTIEVNLANMVKTGNNSATTGIVRSYRGLDGDTSDKFKFYFYHYNYLIANTVGTLGGKGILTLQQTMQEDPAITETDSTIVAAYTGIAIDHSAKTITLTSGTWTSNVIYDYVKYNKCLSANVSKPSVLESAIEFSEGRFISRYRILVKHTALFDIGSGHPLTFTSDVATPNLSGEGSITFGSETTVNGITSYDSGTLVNFEKNNTSWYQNPVMVLDGTLVWKGGELEVQSPLITSPDLSMVVDKGTIKVKDHSLTSPYEINFGSDNITLTDFTIDGRGTFIITSDLVISKFTGKNYDGIFPSGKFRGSSTDFLVVRDYEGIGSFKDHTLWRRNKIQWYNSVNGSNIKVLGKETSSSTQHTGISEFWSEIKIHVTDPDNNDQENVRVALKDYDDSNRTDTSSLTGSASSGHYNTGFDYTPDRTYTEVTDVEGLTPIIPVLFAVVDRSVGGAQATPTSDWSYRSKNGDNSDEFEVFVWQYGKNVATSVISLKGAGVKETKLVTTTDINVTETDKSVVSAYTGIGIDHTTKTITISAQRTLAEIYDYLLYDKTTISGVYHPTLGTKVAGIVGATIDIKDYNLIVDGADIVAGSTGFNLLQTTGLITLQNTATIDFNFLDQIGNAIVTIDLPANWNLEGVYPSQNDALAKTNKLPNSNINYKYLTTSEGGNTIWMRIEDSDGQGIAVDSYELPITRGVYETAAVTSTEDSLLNQIRAIVRDTKTITEDIQSETGGGLSQNYFDDFQKRSGYNLATVEEAINVDFSGNLAAYVNMGFRCPVGKKGGSLVPRRGTAISKVRFYVGQAFHIGTNTYMGGTVQFKIWRTNGPGTLADGNFGDVVWQSPETYQLDDLENVGSNSVVGSGYNHVHRSKEFIMESSGMILEEDYYFGFEVITGEALTPINLSDSGHDYGGLYYEHHRLSGWESNSPGYIRYADGGRPVPVDITEYNYNLITQYKLKADIDDIKDVTDKVSFNADNDIIATLDNELTDIMDVSKRAPYVYVDGCPTAEANGAYRLLSTDEVDWLNANGNLDSDIAAGDTAVLDRSQPVYGLDRNEWVLGAMEGEYGYRLFPVQNTTTYYSSNNGFYDLAQEVSGDPTVGKSWYALAGKFDADNLVDGAKVSIMVVLNTPTMLDDVKDRTDQLQFTDQRVDANVPDQLTESEFDTKRLAKKGWR